MLVSKVKGQDKVDKIILSRFEVEVVQRQGIPLDDYVKQMLIRIAKQRRWKWYFNKEKA